MTALPGVLLHTKLCWRCSILFLTMTSTRGVPSRHCCPIGVEAMFWRIWPATPIATVISFPKLLWVEKVNNTQVVSKAALRGLQQRQNSAEKSSCVVLASRFINLKPPGLVRLGKHGWGTEKMPWVQFWQLLICHYCVGVKWKCTCTT